MRKIIISLSLLFMTACASVGWIFVGTTAATGTPVTYTLIYHTTSPGGVGLLHYDGVDYSRTMATAATPGGFGRFNFKPSSTSKNFTLALTTDVTTYCGDNACNAFQFFFLNNATYTITEAGVVKLSATAYSASDTFDIVLAAGVVTYRQNGSTVYTSLTSPTGKTSLINFSANSGTTAGDIIDNSSFY